MVVVGHSTERNKYSEKHKRTPRAGSSLEGQVQTYTLARWQAPATRRRLGGDGSNDTTSYPLKRYDRQDNEMDLYIQIAALVRFHIPQPEKGSAFCISLHFPNKTLDGHSSKLENPNVRSGVDTGSLIKFGEMYLHQKQWQPIHEYPKWHTCKGTA